jgi:hypothetical protein
MLINFTTKNQNHATTMKLQIVILSLLLGSAAGKKQTVRGQDSSSMAAGGKNASTKGMSGMGGAVRLKC